MDGYRRRRLHHNHCHKSFSQMTCLVWDVKIWYDTDYLLAFKMHSFIHSFNRLRFHFIVMLMEWRRRIKEEEHDVWHVMLVRHLLGSVWFWWWRLQTVMYLCLLVGYNNETFFSSSWSNTCFNILSKNYLYKKLSEFFSLIWM